MEPLRIVLIGYGRMGRMIESIAIERGHRIIEIIDNAGELNLLVKKKHDGNVAIDFSQPEAVETNIKSCFAMGLPVVEGTTGWHERLPEIQHDVIRGDHCLFYAPNFSIGMNIAFALNRQLAKMTRNTGFTINISEIHHIHKVDAPSGTAIRLANDILEHHKELTGWTIEKTENKNQLHIEVERIGEVNGIHQITTSSPDEMISLRHEAFNRRGFALGAVMAAEFVIGRKGIFTMDDLLNLNW
ncbi:MAG: 4-hydroxy-tetrahydrodipicolinate reductase [Bacteroidales bacterium]|nr:4-hydroxy-tetrahydrodipicolinate reductase [Bacteroidales bacterium]